MGTPAWVAKSRERGRTAKPRGEETELQPGRQGQRKGETQARGHLMSRWASQARAMVPSSRLAAEV